MMPETLPGSILWLFGIHSGTWRSQTLSRCRIAIENKTPTTANHANASVCFGRNPGGRNLKPGNDFNHGGFIILGYSITYGLPLTLSPTDQIRAAP